MGISRKLGNSDTYFDGTAIRDGNSVTYRFVGNAGTLGSSVAKGGVGRSIDGIGTSKEGITNCVGSADTDRLGANVYVGIPSGTDGSSVLISSVGNSVGYAGFEIRAGS